MKPIVEKIIWSDLSQMLRIWNQHYNVLTTSKQKHTKKSLNLWYENPGEISHDFFGLFEKKNVEKVMELFLQNLP